VPETGTGEDGGTRVVVVGFLITLIFGAFVLSIAFVVR